MVKVAAKILKVSDISKLLVQKMLNLLCNVSLVDAETEIGNGGIEVFEYGCHLLLVALPLLFVEEEIELHGQTCGGCLVLSHHIDHFGIHVSMAGEIAFGIGAEEGQVHGVVAHVALLQQSLYHIATITESLAYGIVDVANETEVEIKNPASNAKILKPKLLFMYFRLMDYYVQKGGMENEISELLLHIKILDPDIYKIYAK